MTRPRRIPQPHPAMLALSRKLADTERRLRDLETASQAGFTSVEGRTLDFYDPVTDEKLGSIGLQPDGTFGFERTGGAKPEAPTEPDVQPIPGGAIVAWDGRFEDTQSMLEIDRIAVHMDETAGFTVTRDTEVAAIYSHAGGTTVIPIDDGTEWYVKLVAVTKGQVWSDPSVEVYVAAVDANIAFFQDQFTLTTGGAQDLTLTFEPIANSEHLYWNGLYQDEDISWTRLGNTVTLIGGEAEAGDIITVEYAYLDDSDITVVPWQAAGWSYLQVASGDTTDRSATGFDDSVWTVAPAAFAKNTTSAHPYGYPTASTLWGVGTRLWIRRHVDDVPDEATWVHVLVRVDDTADVYWNGALLGSCTSVVGSVTEFEFDVPSWGATNVLAVRGTDAPAGDPNAPENWTYLDISVVAGRS